MGCGCIVPQYTTTSAVFTVFTARSDFSQHYGQLDGQRKLSSRILHSSSISFCLPGFPQPVIKITIVASSGLYAPFIIFPVGWVSPVVWYMYSFMLKMKMKPVIFPHPK